jgi:tetratricopeptide (TPR) repeat protein
MPARSTTSEWDAFVSHASEDDALATRISERLTEDHLSVWVDHQNLRRKGLLLEALQTAIEQCRHVVLLWSRDSAGSRYVTAEWNFAWNRERPIVACRLDKTKLPLGLAGFLYCDFRSSFETGVGQLRDALEGRTPGPSARAKAHVPKRGKQVADRNTAVQAIHLRQSSCLDALGRGKLVLANKIQLELDPLIAAAEAKFPHDADILGYAGYHRKNAYMIKHWEAVQARQSPSDPLLAEAEAYFWEALKLRPNDASALNGLGSILWLRGDLDAAEFYVKRSIERARQEGFSYPYAEEDLRNIQREKAQRAGQ